jgi:hypothetical protein
MIPLGLEAGWLRLALFCGGFGLAHYGRVHWESLS